jgi:hypothetical protein
MLFTGIDDLLTHDDLGLTGEIEGETGPGCVADQVLALSNK